MRKSGNQSDSRSIAASLLLCDEDIPGLDTNYKMNPPLRSPEDRAALIEGLLDGTIDFIATDHAPHTEEEKNTEMKLAPFGIVGLETAFPLLYTHFVKNGSWSLKQLIDYMTIKPCEAFGLPYGTLQTGQAADITLIDLEKEAVIDKETFLSKGKIHHSTASVAPAGRSLQLRQGSLLMKRGDLSNEETISTGKRSGIRGRSFRKLRTQHGRSRF